VAFVGHPRFDATSRSPLHIMGKRRKAREVALQFLYQLDLNSDDDPIPHDEEFWARHPVDDDTRAFADALVRGAKSNQAKIDHAISQFAEHWDLERMAVVDRNILRLAVYELLWTLDVPPKVAINEAIEIAKKFGTKESSRFINGLLDRIHKELRPTF
jgi:transcription antitermination factor NusB